MATITRELVEAAEKNLEWLRQQRNMSAETPTCALGNQIDNVTSRRPQVHEELSELGCAIDSLEKAIAVLHDRLSMVTRVGPPREVTTGRPEPTETQKVPLSNIISEYRLKVRLFQTIVTDLTERVEV